MFRTGIADYKDGLTNKKWQNHASLAAAAVVKSTIIITKIIKNKW